MIRPIIYERSFFSINRTSNANLIDGVKFETLLSANIGVIENTVSLTIIGINLKKYLIEISVEDDNNDRPALEAWQIGFWERKFFRQKARIVF